MRRGFLSSLTALFLGAGLAPAQPAALKTDPYRVERLPGGVDSPAYIVQRVASTPFLAPSGCLDSGSCATSCATDSGCLQTIVCAPRYQFWGRAEYLLWWIEDTPLPPLVTTSPVGSGAVLGQPGTTILFGGEEVENNERSGGRFALGMWLDECQHVGIEGSYLFLGSRSVTFTAGTPGTAGTPVLGVPFFDVLANAENAQVFASPNMMAGNIQVALSSRLQGYELNGLYNIGGGCCDRLDLRAGFRYLQLDEGLNLTENFMVTPGVPVFGGSQFSVADQIAAHTRFYGGQIGARAELRQRRWSLEVVSKIAFGTSHQVVGINGTTVFAPPGIAPTAGQGGVFGQPTNSGRRSRDEFAVLPEVGVTVGYHLTSNLRAFLGYTFVYLSEAVRPGEQIDRALNISQIPAVSPGPLTGPRRPALGIESTDFWAQGINLGFEFRY